MNIIVSSSLDGDEDILLSRQALEKMILLPPNWPFCSDDTDIITSKLSKEEADEIISDIRDGNIERCLKTLTKEGGKDGSDEKKSHDEFLTN